MLNDISYGIVVFKKIFDKTHVLLINRPTIDGFDLPKGHMDDGESTIKAALREVGEETGYWNVEIIDDVVVHINYPITKNKQKVNKEVFFYFGWHNSHEVPTPQHDPNCIREQNMTCDWIKLDQVELYIKFPPMLKAVKTFIALYEK